MFPSSPQQLFLMAAAYLVASKTTTAFQVTVHPSLTSPSPTQLGYTATVELPELTRSSLEENVRKLMIPQETVTPRSTSQPQSPIHNLLHLTTVSDFARIVRAENNRKMTVVRFHAPFCKACRAMQPAWERLARQHPEMNFVNLEFNPETKAFIREMGIKSVPFGQIYHPQAGLVWTANFGKRFFPTVVQQVESYANGECPLQDQIDPDSLVYESPALAMAL